jgi:hypothetical protein
MNTLQRITTDNHTYDLDDLSPDARAQLQSLQFCDAELARLQAALPSVLGHSHLKTSQRWMHRPMRPGPTGLQSEVRKLVGIQEMVCVGNIRNSLTKRTARWKMS